MLELTIVGRLANVPTTPTREIALRGPDDEPQAYSWSAGSQYWLEIPEIGLFCVDERGAVRGIPYGSVDRLLDAFDGRVVPLALQALGFEVLHASAVCLPAGLVAFCAFSEMGKSTTAAAFGARGHPIWADDAVALEIDAAGAIVAWPLNSTVKLRSDVRSHFRTVGGASSVAGAREPTRLAAVILLDRTASEDGVVDVHRLTGAAALEALLPHGFRFSLAEPNRTRRMVENYLTLVSKLPILRARFPTGLPRLPSVVEEIESALHRELPVSAA